MNINDKFSLYAIETMKEIIDSNNGESILMRGITDENSVIIDITEIKTKKNTLSSIISQVKKKEFIIKNSKSGYLFPSDEDIDLASAYSNKLSGGFCIINNEVNKFDIIIDIENKKIAELDIVPYFEEKGLLSSSISNFEFREEQLEMATVIQDAINSDKKAIIEAGTGTGKTLAYLIPAIKWAVQNSKKVVIATNTINLQEQLLYKDMPIAKKVIEENFKYVLVKGRNNYLCKRQFLNIYKGERIDLSQFSEDQKLQLKKILDWGIKTEQGDKSELNFEVDYEVWELVQSTSELCLGKKCPYREECFYMKARKDKADADVLISNHHVFFSDLRVRSENEFDAEYLVLPKYDLLVFDEAHNISNVARSYFSVEVSKFGFMRLMGQILENKDKNRKRKLRPALDSFLDSIQGDDLEKNEEFKASVSEVREIHSATLNKGKDYFDELILTFSKSSQNSFSKTLKEDEMLFSPFLSGLREKRDEFDEYLNIYLKHLSLIEKMLKSFVEKNQYAANFVNHINKLANFLASFKIVNDFSDPHYIYWTEINTKISNSVLIAAPLNVDDMLEEALYVNLNKIIFTSATISVNNNFEYFKSSIGLKDETLEKIIASPFDYDKQMNVYIPTDIIDSDRELNFNEQVGEFLKSLLLKTKGKAFLLFTSYRTLNHVYYSIASDLRKNGINVFLHGEKPRSYLINEFKKMENPVLFGTSSFWEGVDIRGEQLENVIIVKLPFLVPSDPIVSAISMKLEASGKNSFMDFQIPEAVIKFKQGIGRLIRSKTDKGNVIILDNRVIKKRYGSYFIKAIPTKKIKKYTMNKILSDIE